MSIARPPGARIGDVLVLLTATMPPAVSSTFDSGLEQLGHCQYPNLNAVGYAARIDDGTPSYVLGLDPTTSYATAMLFAFANAGLPDSHALKNCDTTTTPGAPRVMLRRAPEYVLTAFASAAMGTRQGDASAAGLDLIWDLPIVNGYVQAYGGLFREAGATSELGPFTDASACWGALTVAVPPP